MNEVIEKAKSAKQASYQMALSTTDDKNEALQLISQAILDKKQEIITANVLDIEEGKKKGLSDSVIDRIKLNEERLQDIAEAILQVTILTDPIGETLEIIEKDNGLFITKKRVPIGVIGMVYEARPNVTVDAASLAIKTGNAVVLRGSSSAIHSNKALIHVIHDALTSSSIPKEAVQLIEDTRREVANQLFQLNEYLDVLIPRGGKQLIETVVKQSTVPVIETGAGNCHVYLDESAKVEMATEIVLNAKLQRPSVCNAIESLIIHKQWFENHGLELLKSMQSHDITIHGDGFVMERFPTAIRAEEKDWETEYLASEISVKIVGSVSEAIAHINRYGTRHSEAIITENKINAEQFQLQVDAAAVYHNASTRFTDGFEFGYGAEIGISTQKLHARGPMGLEALTSTKFVISGSGQIRN
ncbi:MULTISPECIES: glutamate-5-semialdehyde dehydrogenase [Oceanobacillus]|uniref:Gamma-glutamyl phosphate reductase n=1 Tax=Oceanobacillus kimchii TaxID=746691 RepID=A0ABQ5TIE1_9BACI|nr:MULTISPECIES: glutamate-5-semialdehyde dehydrogenase [Oceanobacillus]MBT2599240.1 glutamate-5-semialdehyde dehydrogenase [Oceanobacillus sp. ISL-74]MBT2652158.1 glutamate-5-semialdehyde dehydrogenase [Oceanobacillus sp. ISL-73]MCT1578560.1 glutamate-5-semialdehyde dehydrogenase [Oceanobacillus kimchii]MCT2136391.1 glutamate-5-semialdehyde dehydrogenase [Oceanobacillus kimchii]OEH54200.1 gamma-glutamyl-phosphate reductase [Oceanobacillus sp. E9]